MSLNSPTELVHQLFIPYDATRILKIPILDPKGADELIWWRSKDGQYSVRSAYFGTMEDLIDNSQLRNQGVWLNLWRLKIPQKVKLLLWRTARGCLPLHSNLRRWHVPCEELCPMCKTGIEDEMHIFLPCTHTTQI